MNSGLEGSREIKAVEEQKIVVGEKRIQEYWEKHPDEKAVLDNERDKLEKEKQTIGSWISELMIKKDSVPA